LASHIKAFLTSLRDVIKGGKNSSQTKARNFEIPVQGGFQLTDYVPSIEDYFNIGKELICYSDVDEAKELINYYLKHNKERERIKIECIKKARKNHLFSHRIVEFMKRLEIIKNNDQ
jgi:spore maturation protein CgeB